MGTPRIIFHMIFWPIIAKSFFPRVNKTKHDKCKFASSTAGVAPVKSPKRSRRHTWARYRRYTMAMVHNALRKLSSTWGIREPVPGKDCLLLCAGVLVTSQALIGRPPRRNEIKTSPLLTCACSILSSIRSIRSTLLCFFSYTCSLTFALLLVLLGSGSLVLSPLLFDS